MAKIISTIVTSALLLSACASLLPKSEIKTETPWKTFDAARALYDQVIPLETTLDDLKQLRIDPYTTPNIAILNYTDLIRRFLSGNTASNGFIEASVKDCLSAKEACSGYEINQRFSESQRKGNFWLDVFNFRRETDTKGWHFNAIILMKNDRVVYKLWSGEPATYETREDKNPLGPLQSFGESQMRR